MIHKFGSRISSNRKERNMSQEELATLLNVSRQTVSKWETGDTLPDVYNAVALAKMFHMSLDSLVMGSNSKLGGPSYVTDLREKRQRTNFLAIIVGASGTTTLVVSTILARTLEFSQKNFGILMMFVLPVLMICWGYAIWGFIKTARYSNEIKYLEQIEIESVRNNFILKNLDQK